MQKYSPKFSIVTNGLCFCNSIVHQLYTKKMELDGLEQAGWRKVWEIHVTNLMPTTTLKSTSMVHCMYLQKSYFFNSLWVHTTRQQTSISLEECDKGNKIIWKELIELQAPRNCLGLTLLCETKRKKKDWWQETHSKETNTKCQIVDSFN
jgi:hypothetical protein